MSDKETGYNNLNIPNSKREKIVGVEEISRENIDEIGKNENPKIEVKEEEVYFIPRYKWIILFKILRTKFPPEEAKLYAKKIIKRVEQLHLSII